LAFIERRAGRLLSAYREWPQASAWRIHWVVQEMQGEFPAMPVLCKTFTPFGAAPLAVQQHGRRGLLIP